MKYTYGTGYLMSKMNEELKAKGYETKCYRSPLSSWVVETLDQADLHKYSDTRRKETRVNGGIQ